MNKNDNSIKEGQELIINKLMELSGRIISIQKDSRIDEPLKQIIKFSRINGNYLRIIKRELNLYFIFTCLLFFLTFHYQELRKILSIVF